ncbi:hypothetical protein FHS72_001528 [Loktanella ponticola]|uniref:Uncharacterized protein n=1 Tax=Yoonia ponticola TaxID=1524255 RepID=A0A7W9BKS3_9RHOB|nr:hypothetical protein [Yoonia ponticola]MBB5721904.1 hypothetical protein [Yoonia ponticola]
MTWSFEMLRGPLIGVTALRTVISQVQGRNMWMPQTQTAQGDCPALIF